MPKVIKKTLGFLILTFIGALFMLGEKSGTIPFSDWHIFLGSWIGLTIVGGGIIIGVKLLIED